MSRRVELDSARGELVISFPYQPDLVAEVKALPRRRWDPTCKVWRVPSDDAQHVQQLLGPLGFRFDEAGADKAGASAAVRTTAEPAPSAAARASARGLGTGTGTAPTLFDTGAQDASAPRDDTLTLSQLTEQVDVALKQRFPLPVWVVGEVVDLRPRSHRHMFFSLVEKHEGENHPRAKVDAAVFQRVADDLVPMLRDKGLELQDGIAIRARVRVDFWRQAGRFRLVVEDIDPAFTLGQLAVDREKLLAELRAAGLDQRQPALPLPRPPLRLGVLTSPSADGWTDFRRQLEESGFGFALTLVPVKVQGADLERTVLAGLRLFAERADEFDAVCVVRGGGSRTDLAWFDNRKVALAVARHPLKVLVGIGHERDRSVLDEIAHREKTPTALGAFLVGRVQSELDVLAQAVAMLRTETRTQLDDARRELQRAGHVLGQRIAARMEGERARLRSCQRGIRSGALRHVQETRAAWMRSRQRLRTGTAVHLTLHRGRLEQATTALRKSSQRVLERTADRLERAAVRCRLLDPRRVLERGFSLLRDDGGRVVTDAARTRAGATIRIQMRDGELGATVSEVRAHGNRAADPSSDCDDR